MPRRDWPKPTTTLAKGRDAVQQMEAWQQRSLPADREKALSLYKAWLLAKAKEAGLARQRHQACAANDRVHRVQRDRLPDGGDRLAVVGRFDALRVLSQPAAAADHAVAAARGRPERRSCKSRWMSKRSACPARLPPTRCPKAIRSGSSWRASAEYQKSLGERDLVTVYTPPRPPGPPPAERKDPPPPPSSMKRSWRYFSGTVSSGKGLQAWINVRSTGETLHLMAGDAVKVGALEGQIESIEARSLVLKTGDKKFRVALGQSLRKGKELDADGNVKPEPASEPPKS